jgi:Uma2 family endonuclease
MVAPLDIPVELHEQRRITVPEFHRMVEAGVIGEDERVELLEGVLVAMPPMGGPHAWTVAELNHILTRALPEGYRVRPQLPVTLGQYSEPQPDLAVIALPESGRPHDHPETALLVVEVSVSSLRHDRKAKAPLYARAGIPEYWIVDVEGRAVEVHLDPDRVSAVYRSVRRAEAAETLQARFAPLPAIRVCDVVGQ